QAARNLVEPDALVLVAASGMESSKNPRRNHTLYDKLLYLDALKRGFEATGRRAAVLTAARPEEEPDAGNHRGPAVVLGYIKELLNRVNLGYDGRLSLFGRPVTAAVNDRFCLNVLSRFAHRVDTARFATVNRSFLVGADKGAAYGLLNEYARAHPS